MTQAARPFGLVTGGVDRRVLSDRRQGDRRQKTIEVTVERRNGTERRSGRGRRITEWFPVRPIQTPVRAGAKETPTRAPTSERSKSPATRATSPVVRKLLINTEKHRGATEIFYSHTFQYDGRTYDIEGEDLTDDRGRPTGRRWLVKANGVVEHTLRALPNEDRTSLEQRTIQAIENTGVGAVRELKFTFGGKRYHLEDWSNALSHGGTEELSMWCVTCDGVIEGTFAAQRNEVESALRQRAIEIARRSGAFQAVSERTSGRVPAPPAARRKPQAVAAARVEEEFAHAGSMFTLAWIVLGLFTARAVSGLVQTVFFGGP